MHDTHCRLVTIMFVQVTEISEFRKEIPVATHRLERYLKALSRHLRHYHGVLLEIRIGEIYAYFPGAALAFNAAVSLQKKMAQFNLRTGLHVGEVLFRQGKLQGTDVNLAARLPYCARAGGVCLSRTVYQYLKGLDKQKLIAIGAHDLKNLDIRMPLYAYLPEGQVSRNRGRELRHLLYTVVGKYWQKKSVKTILLASSTSLFIAFIATQIINPKPLNQNVISLYLPAFANQTGKYTTVADLEGIEVVIRSRLSGDHGAFGLVLLDDRSQTTAELLVKVSKIAGYLEVEYSLRSIPEGLVLASGSENQEGLSLFKFQDRVSNKIFNKIDKMRIRNHSLALNSVAAKLD